MRVSDEVRHCAPRSAQLAYNVGDALVAPVICAASVGLRDGPQPLWERMIAAALSDVIPRVAVHPEWGRRRGRPTRVRSRARSLSLSKAKCPMSGPGAARRVCAPLARDVGGGAGAAGRRCPPRPVFAPAHSRLGLSQLMPFAHFTLPCAAFASACAGWCRIASSAMWAPLQRRNSHL